MKVDVRAGEAEFNVAAWWAKTPEGVVNVLRKQLVAAQAVWPELSAYTIVKREPRPTGDKAKAGAAGGAARAASLSSERRSEIASIAATARWGKPKEIA